MKKKKSVQDIIKIFVLSFKISYNASKPVMILRLIIMFVSAFIPLINTYSIKNITDSLIYQRLEQVIIWFAILAVTQISSAVIGKIITYLSNIHDDKITHQTTLSIIDKINDLDISYFDDSKFYDELSNVTRDINDIPKFVWTVFSTIQILIKFVSSFIILLSFNAYSPFIICLSCIPNFILDKKYSLKFYSWNRKSANDIRKINYTYDVLTSKYFSKDLRINSLYKSMREKYILQWNNWLNKKKELLFRQFLFTFVTMFLPHITTLFFSYQLIVSIVKGVNSVGDFSYFISLMGQVTTGTLNFISSVSNILENMMKIELFNDFNTWKTRLPKSGERIAKDFKSLEFIDVSFKFPGTEKYILKHVSFKINKGEKIAIVGKNGAGKSTLIKLILRLYTPDSGLIKLNGFNVDEYEYKSYYKIFSVMLQDYINYSFSLSDNIKFSDIHSHHSKKRMLQACLEGDAYDFVKYWKHGLNSYLTKAFDSDGVELSTGQWQKIALSRFFYRKAHVYIMDEPSASLDIESEFSIFKNAFRKCKNKTLILISHKLQNINMMNKIIVLNNGKICEKGTHQELMINKGIYYNLYSLQKSKYVL